MGPNRCHALSVRLALIEPNGLPVRKRHREHEWLEMPQLTR
jgi:hypothetical protein